MPISSPASAVAGALLGFDAFSFPRGQLLVLTGAEAWVLLDNGWVHLTGRVAHEVRSRMSSSGGKGGAGLLERMPLPEAGRVIELMEQGGWQPLRNHLLAKRHGTLFLELTERCNLTCSHCYAHSGPEEGALMDPATARRLLTEAAGIGFERVQLTGGEPLLWPGIEQLAAAGFELGIPQMEIFTNGKLLSPQLLDGLPTQTSFALSFYSSDFRIHDGITGVAGSARATVEAIDLLVSRGFQLRVGAVMMEANADGWEDTRKFLVDRGVPPERVRAAAMSAVGRGDYRPLPQEQTLCDDQPTEPSDLFTWQGKAAVSPTGDVYPCIFARDARLGNIHERGLHDILKHPMIDRVPDLSVPDLYDFCAKRLSCPDCRILVFGLLGQNR